MIIRLTGGRGTGKTTSALRVAGQMTSLDEVVFISPSAHYYKERYNDIKAFTLTDFINDIALMNNRPHIKVLIIDDYKPNLDLKLLLKAVEYEVLIIDYATYNEHLIIDWINSIQSI